MTIKPESLNSTELATYIAITKAELEHELSLLREEEKTKNIHISHLQEKASGITRALKELSPRMQVASKRRQRIKSMLSRKIGDPLPERNAAPQ